MRRFPSLLALAVIIAAFPVWIQGQRTAAEFPITYRVSFPEAEHHWMQVEVTWTNLGSQPFDARMSRSSPGRYAVRNSPRTSFRSKRSMAGGRSWKPLDPMPMSGE